MQISTFKALLSVSTLVLSVEFAHSYDLVISMDPGYREVHTSESLHDISINTVIDKLPTGSTLKGSQLHDARGNIWGGDPRSHHKDTKKVFDGTLTYLHTDNSQLNLSEWTPANYNMKITEVGAEGNLNKETHIDLDFFSRDGQKKDICDYSFKNTASASLTKVSNLTIELKAEDVKNPHIHITRTHSDGTVDGTWDICN